MSAIFPMKVKTFISMSTYKLIKNKIMILNLLLMIILLDKMLKEVEVAFNKQEN